VTPHSRLPNITVATVADPDRVGEAIDEILAGNRQLRRVHGQIVRRQRELRAVVDDDQWHRYMAIEELFNTRWAMTLEVVAKAFYGAGRRARRRGRR
jgi:hypothetical protein